MPNGPLLCTCAPSRILTQKIGSLAGPALPYAMMARRIPLLSVARNVERAVRASIRGRRVVLAVSGGRDSMALLHAAARAAHPSVVCVATFDHGTGTFARRAAALVTRQAAALGFPVVSGHASADVRDGEAGWRE